MKKPRGHFLGKLLQHLAVAIGAWPLLASSPATFAGEVTQRSACDFSLQLQILSDFNGFAVSCSDSRDGRVAMTASGTAVAPLEIYWNSGEISPTAEKLAGGWAKVSVTDATGCRVVDSVFLKTPGQFVPDFDVFGENCLGTADGRIEVLSTTGGISPILFKMDNGLSGPLGTEIGPMAAGTFFMETTDGNGCRDTFGFVLPSGLPFDFSLPVDSAEIFTGDTFRLKLPSMVGVDTVIWQPQPLGSGFFSTDFSPRTSTKFKATAINPLGCTASDELFIAVRTHRDFYAPNIIWRSAVEDANRFFTIYTSGGVGQIERLEVFDRWGELVFSKKNFPAGHPDLGWDGTFQGKRAAADVFTFQAIIRQTDGAAKLCLGSFLAMD